MTGILITENIWELVYEQDVTWFQPNLGAIDSCWERLRANRVLKLNIFWLVFVLYPLWQIPFEEGTALMRMWSLSFLPKTLGDGAGLGLLSQAQKQQEGASPGALPPPHKPNLDKPVLVRASWHRHSYGTETWIYSVPSSTSLPPCISSAVPLGIWRFQINYLSSIN